MLACVGAAAMPPGNRFGAPGKSSRRSSRFICPGPPLGSFTKEMLPVFNELPVPVDIRPRIMPCLGRMPSQDNSNDRIALLQGTLDLLILKTLVLGSCHGQGIARSIQRQSEEVFFVDHGSLYLALQRLEDKKWISAKWGVSENNRKARFYSLTARGRQQLVEKTSEWERLTRAMRLILDGRPSSEEV